MNKRIRELRRQATLVETYTANDGTVAEGKNVDLEKFAELIIKDVFSKIKESCVDTEFTERVDEVIDQRLHDAASDICDAYGIIDRIY